MRRHRRHPVLSLPPGSEQKWAEVGPSCTRSSAASVSVCRVAHRRGPSARKCVRIDWSSSGWCLFAYSRVGPQPSRYGPVLLLPKSTRKQVLVMRSVRRPRARLLAGMAEGTRPRFAAPLAVSLSGLLLSGLLCGVASATPAGHAPEVGSTSAQPSKPSKPPKPPKPLVDLTLSLADESVVVSGENVTFTGTAPATLNGRTVLLNQKRRSGDWFVVGRATITDGTFTISGFPRVLTGTVQWRVSTTVGKQTHLSPAQATEVWAWFWMSQLRRISNYTSDDIRTDTSPLIGGVRYPHSVEHVSWANDIDAVTIYDLGYKCSTFNAWIGVNDKAAPGTGAVYYVTLDGTMFKVGSKGIGAATEITVETAGFLRIELQWYKTGDEQEGLAFGSARVLCSAKPRGGAAEAAAQPAAPKPATDLTLELEGEGPVVGGTKTTFTGSAPASLADTTVLLQRLTPVGWVTVGSSKIGAEGAFSVRGFAVGPGENSWRARAAIGKKVHLSAATTTPVWHWFWMDQLTRVDTPWEGAETKTYPSMGGSIYPHSVQSGDDWYGNTAVFNLAYKCSAFNAWIGIGDEGPVNSRTGFVVTLDDLTFDVGTKRAGTPTEVTLDAAGFMRIGLNWTNQIDGYGDEHYVFGSARVLCNANPARGKVR